MNTNSIKKIIVICSFILPLCMVVSAQSRSEDFKISMPEKQVQNSLYKTIEVIDTRSDTTNMGIVQLGAFNKKAKVVPTTAFNTQLDQLMRSLTDESARNGELLFHLRQLNFAEITGAMSEKGYCYLKAGLYTKVSEKYQKIGSIDTVVLIKSLDVTKAMFRNGSKTISGFIAENLTKNPFDTTLYTSYEITKLDSIEKRKIVINNVSSYTDGLYKTFESFINQIPDEQVTVEMEKEKIESVKRMAENGKLKKINTKDMYAVVYKGQPFIVTEYGYYPLAKKDDDFFFTGKAKVNANAGDVIAASLFFGIIGGLIASDVKANIEMKIDHTNGGFIRIREAKAISGDR